MSSNVISKNVYHDKLDVGEEEGDEWVDEDDKEKRRQHTALGDSPTQRTRRGDVRRRVHHKKRAIREEGTNPQNKIRWSSHGNELGEKSVMRYRIKRLRNIKENHGECRTARKRR